MIKLTFLSGQRSVLASSPIVGFGRQKIIVVISLVNKGIEGSAKTSSFLVNNLRI